MTEEFNLTVNNDDEDVTAAEFIRTFNSVTFPGRKLLLRYTAEREREHMDVDVPKVIPSKEDKILFDFDETYRVHRPDS